MEEVQSYISNISFPKTLDEFIYFLEDGFHFNVDDILTESSVEWNAPRWCKIGDIVFFMHAKTAISIITKLRSEYIKNKALYTKSKQLLIEKGIEHAIEDYKNYGGKIFAIGRVIDSTMYDDFYRDEVELHWKGRIYAPIGDIIILENPIDISEFNDFIFISRQSSITGVFGKEFEQLKSIILSKNKTKEYFKKCISTAIPISKISAKNWLDISTKYRRNFFLESQFRSYYTDYLLKELTDNKVFRECRCKSQNKPDYYVDNVVIINAKPLLIEIKLDINNEKDLISQMEKYCNCDNVTLGSKDIPIPHFYNSRAIIIDTNSIYLYDDFLKTIKEIYNLEDLKTYKDIDNVKKAILISIE